MNRRRTRMAGFCIFLGALEAFAAGAAQTPSQAYLAYNAALAKATKLADVLPYLSREYRGMLESRPKEDQPRWLKNLQESAMKDVKITKETISGEKCTLEATGTSERGNTMKGKIHLVRESGEWKLDEEGWAT